jgi:hypothetical protein
MNKGRRLKIESYRNFKREMQHIPFVDIDIYGDEYDEVMNGGLFLE